MFKKRIFKDRHVLFLLLASKCRMLGIDPRRSDPKREQWGQEEMPAHGAAHGPSQTLAFTKRCLEHYPPWKHRDLGDLPLCPLSISWYQLLELWGVQPDYFMFLHKIFFLLCVRIQVKSLHENYQTPTCWNWDMFAGHLFCHWPFLTMCPGHLGLVS